MKEECPIGLICKHFDCRPKVCRDYAAPIDLPYEIWLDDGYYPKGAFICQLPEFEEYPDREETDWVLYHRAERNFRIARIRAEMEAEGWGGLAQLPYSYNADIQALEVDSTHFLEGDDLKFDVGCDDCDSLARGFVPALPLDLHFIPTAGEIQLNLNSDGFCSTLLIWDDYYEFDMY